MPGGAPLGNTNGTKHKPLADMLRKLSVQEDHKRLRAGADKVLTAIEAGEEWALVFYRDTTEGKPKQQTEITGEDGGPVYIKTGIERLLTEAAVDR